MNPVISNNFALTALKQGEDAFVCDLTNQMAQIAVDASNKVIIQTVISTTARIIKGAGTIPSGITPTPAASMVIAGVTPTVNIADGEVTYSWTFAKDTVISDARTVKKITLTYDGHSYKADFTLVTDKSGATYDLHPSMTEIPFVRDNDNVLIPASTTIYCGYVKDQNGTIITVNGKGNNQHANIDGLYYIYYRIKNADGSFGNYTQMTKGGIKVNNSDTYAAIEFILSSANTVGGIADGNIRDIEDVPVVRQNERGYGIVCSVQRDNFTEAQWNTDPGYGVIGHEDTWADTSAIRNNARKGDLFTVVGAATDTRNGHTATYRCTNASGNLVGVCIAHAISKGGLGINSADIVFVLSDSGTTAPADNVAWKTTFADLDIKSANASKYVWQATKIVFSNNTTKYTGKQCLGKVSEFASITEQYALGTASAATGTWQDNTPPAAEKGKYLWTRTKLTYSGGGTTYTPSENGQCIGYYGSDGNEGNGIKTVSLYRMFTPTFSAPSSSDSSWASYTDGSTTYVPEKLSSQSNPPKNYLWEKKVTSYTKTNSTTVEIRLVAQIDMGVCANLLQDTAFASDGQMEAWTVRNQYSPVSGQSTPAESGAGEIKTNVTLDGQNSYYDKTAYGTDKLTYKEVLQQIIYQTATDGIKKITTSQWYTLSFYVKGYTRGYGNLSTYIYPSCIDTNQAFYIDGVLQSSTPSDGAVNWKVKITTSWVRHSVTFRTKSSISTEQKVLFRLIPESSNTSYNQIWLCMPKLERNSMATEWIENSDDRMADDIQHVYVGNWVSGTTYYYGGGTGVRHVVRAKESASGSMTYWRMKKRTSSAGYTSTTQPYSDTSHWEKANYLKFVATDLLLAEEIIVENLIPTQIKSKNNKFVVDADGNVTAEGGTYKDITAVNITANTGTIGGFTLSSNGLTNIVPQSSMSQSNMGYIICRNDYYGRFAGIGANVLPASSGSAAVARFENTDEHSWYSDNIAMILKASGKSGWAGITKNIACATYGGCFSGFALNTRIVNAASYSQTVQLTESDNVVTIIGTKDVTIKFPQVYRYDDGHILIIKRDGDMNVKLYPGYYVDDDGNYRNTYIRYDRGDIVVGTLNYLSVESWGDSMMFIFHSNLQVTKDGTTYYGSWIQYKLPRDW